MNFNKGTKIIFLGCDGSGKTTIINTLREDIPNKFKNKYSTYYHFKPRILTIIGSFKKSMKIEDKTNIGYETDEFIEGSNQFKQSIKYIYYLLDYVLFNFIKVSDNNILLFDRYNMDMNIHPEKYDVKANKYVYKLLDKFMAKPDIVIYLYNSAEELYKRKKEFSIERYNELLERYEVYLKEEESVYFIKTDKSLEANYEEVLNIVSKYINKS